VVLRVGGRFGLRGAIVTGDLAAWCRRHCGGGVWVVGRCLGVSGQVGRGGEG
jgi:hypothetical protein